MLVTEEVDVLTDPTQKWAGLREKRTWMCMLATTAVIGISLAVFVIVYASSRV